MDPEMKSSFRASSLAFVIGIAISSACAAQHVNVPTPKLTSSDPNARAEGFFEMIDAAERNHAKEGQAQGSRGPRVDLLASDARGQIDLSLALITLLEKENAYRDQSGGSLPPDWGDGYYAYLGNTVAMLDDRRAAKALIGAMNLGYRQIRAVASLGSVAAPDLLKTLRQGPDKIGAAMALGMMVADREKLALGPGTIESIKNGLLYAIRSEADYVLRAESIEALWTVDGPDVRAIMESVSAHEPPALGSGNVQRAANRWLDKHR
jgi:hypothetical protein